MRSRSLLVSLALVSGGLAALTGTIAPTSSASSTLEERWCAGPSTPRPCVTAFSRNGSAVAEGGAYVVQLNTPQPLDGGTYVNWQVVDSSGASTLAPGDTWSVTLDMGSMKPRYTEGYSGGTVVTRGGTAGAYTVTIEGRSVRMAESCKDEYPPVCQNPTPFASTATWRGVSGAFNGEIWDLEGDGGDASWRNGYDRSQSVDGVNDPDFAPTSDGGYRFSTETYNAATYDDDGSPATAPKAFRGEFKFRLPYSLMRQRLGVPDPDTLPVSLLSGTTSGSGIDGTWTITKDASARVFYAEVVGVTYPDTVSGRTFLRAASKTQVRTLRVKRGVIVPFAPRSVSAVRTTTSRGRLSYAAARARGARPTGYSVRCVNLAGTHVVTASDTASPTVVTGLRTGKAYDCRVRAKSKAGPGIWSAKVRLAARP